LEQREARWNRHKREREKNMAEKIAEANSEQGAGSKEQGAKSGSVLHAPSSMPFDQAKNVSVKERVAGLKVKGSVAPFGGSWSYNKDADELTLTMPPTVLP
jgi:hypothetical protein